MKWFQTSSTIWPVASVYGHSTYGSFRLRFVRPRLEAIYLRLICQFAYVLEYILQQLIHLRYVQSCWDASQYDFVFWINQLNINRCFGVKLPLYS